MRQRQKRKHGLYKTYYENDQQLSEENYNDGMLEGKWTDWHENGQKKSEGHFNTNRLEGKWTEWDENGHTIREEYYKLGELINWKITKIPKLSGE